MRVFLFFYFSKQPSLPLFESILYKISFWLIHEMFYQYVGINCICFKMYFGHCGPKTGQKCTAYWYKIQIATDFCATANLWNFSDDMHVCATINFTTHNFTTSTFVRQHDFMKIFFTTLIFTTSTFVRQHNFTNFFCATTQFYEIF